MQGVVQRVVEALVGQVELTLALLAKQACLGIEHLFDAVTDTKVGAVHVTGNDEDYRDRQVVVGNVRQPQGLGLGVEATEEGQNRVASTISGTENVVCRVGVLRVNAPVTGKEGSQASGVRLRRKEVTPVDGLATRRGNRNVYQVTGPSQGANAKQRSQVVVQAVFCLLEPREAGTELGLQVQPASVQEHRRQQQQEDSSLVQLRVGGHADGVEPVVHAGEGDVHGACCVSLGEGIDSIGAEVGIPNRVGDGARAEGIGNPLFKVALPRNVEQGSGGPEEDDCEVTEVRGENLLVEIFLGHAIVALEVVSGGNPVPNPTSRRVLGEILAKFWELSSHFLLEFLAFAARGTRVRAAIAS